MFVELNDKIHVIISDVVNPKFNNAQMRAPELVPAYRIILFKIPFFSNSCKAPSVAIDLFPPPDTINVFIIYI